MKPPRSRSGSSKKDTGPKRIPGKALKSAAAPGAADATQDASTSQTARNKVVTLRTARGRTTAQQRWLNRQLNDPYVAADHMRIMGLAEGALDFAVQVLAEGGSFVAKVFQGGSEKQMLESMKKAFSSVKHVKPPASRKESSELYVIATGFRPERLSDEG